MTTKRDLALAYSPGVAAPVKAIYKNPELAYDYTRDFIKTGVAYKYLLKIQNVR